MGPDSQPLVFAKGYLLYVIRADGSGVHRITRDPALKRDPVWSPTGNEIAYVVTGLDPDLGSGSTYRCGFGWVLSPYGRKIAYDGYGRHPATLQS